MRLLFMTLLGLTAHDNSRIVLCLGDCTYLAARNTPATKLLPALPNE
jgi:hypothetical protein